ncbi:uncharacterized protein P174DRAFT_509415 [Aspergillus novofumigatus IBT 16806]|uniref:Uncharacterized protein n=1 Tax=Aspergillus novofumigatus (strain IBT 16806) TaxID=1392255 RepID=A0A2I1CPA6_ASPN1|nr:uncharacterized protein P174DRAFT_509415 [Aspergillus novofumigatus IBT 16806]PKX99464.1 hypothetical protein P174DRAFT_509415 [Aspergillus novofumigatus IBT 16806]
MKYKNANTAVIRFLQPGATMFPEEEVRNEVATMRYIYDQTSIPESPLGLGPFIILDYIDHVTSMYDVLNTPGCPEEDRGILDPDMSKMRLEALYGEVARSLDQVDDFAWEVTRRALSMPMNALIQLGSLPQVKLPTTTFDRIIIL